MNIEEVLQSLLDRNAIEDLITWRFARAIDWIDVEAAKSCFHPDARFKFDQTDLNAHEFCEMFAKSAINLKMRYHFIGNAGIAQNGDLAQCEAYAIYAATYDDKDSGEPHDYMVGCRYVSRVERRDGIWRIADLQILFDWSIGQKSPEKTASGNNFDRNLTRDSHFYSILDPLAGH